MMQPRKEDGCTLATGAAATLPAPIAELLVASAVDTRAPTRRARSSAPRMATLPAEFAGVTIGAFDATTGNQTGEIGLWGRWLAVRGGSGSSPYIGRGGRGRSESSGGVRRNRTNEIRGMLAR
jgi:hypothetical protein